MRRFPVVLAWLSVLVLCGVAYSAPKSQPASSGPASQSAGPATKKGTDPAAQEKAKQLQEQAEKARKIADMNRRLLALFKEGKYEKCEGLLNQILAIDPNDEGAWYNMACCHSKQGRKDKAISTLCTAVEHGWSDFRHMERDTDLDAIRQMEGYKKLLAMEDQIQRERASKICTQLRQEFGEGYLYEIDHQRKLVFATNVDAATLEEMKKRLTVYASGQWQDLFTHHQFDRYLAIVVPKSSWWQKTGKPPALGGFYSRAANMLCAKTVGTTLIHEFTHALHAADQGANGQDHPIWVTEGLATLFEYSKVTDGHSEPQTNYRLNVLQDFLRRGRALPLTELIGYSQVKFMQNAMLAYSQSRYVMMYLHDKGVLKKWYDAYVDGFQTDPLGGKAMEKVLGKGLKDIEKDWRDWVLKLKPAMLRLPPKHAYMGIQLSPVTDGVQVMRIVSGSGAEKAGLRVGDVIMQIGPERVIDPEQLTAIVEEHGVGDTLAVHFRRDGKYQDVTVTLSAMPEEPIASKPAKKPASKPATPAATTPASKPASAPASRKAA
jgi:tetratricopeptide (TPR) repeat protein